MDRQSTIPQGQVRIIRTITINRSPEELFNYWRQLENLPQIMRHLQQVEVLDGRTSEWTARAPAGTTVSWKAEIIQEHTNELLEWRSCHDSPIQTSGRVRFDAAPVDRGTQLTVQIDYRAPGGLVGRAVAWFYGEEPSQHLEEDLRRFKWFMETGELPTAPEGTFKPSEVWR